MGWQSCSCIILACFAALSSNSGLPHTQTLEHARALLRRGVQVTVCEPQQEELQRLYYATSLHALCWAAVPEHGLSAADRTTQLLNSTGNNGSISMLPLVHITDIVLGQTESHPWQGVQLSVCFKR